MLSVSLSISSFYLAVSSNLLNYLYILTDHIFLFYLDALVPVTIVQLGEPVTFTCIIPKELGRKRIHWYKQSPGESLNIVVVIASLLNPKYGPDFSASRFQIKEDEDVSNLTILETISGDQGMYHCGLMDYFSLKWSASYLLIEGKKNNMFLFLHVCDGHIFQGHG